MRRKINEDAIIEAMNFSKYGALSQAFIMQAIEQMCNAVIDNEEEILKEKSTIVHMPSWVGVAKEIKAILDTRGEEIMDDQKELDDEEDADEYDDYYGAPYLDYSDRGGTGHGDESYSDADLGL